MAAGEALPTRGIRVFGLFRKNSSAALVIVSAEHLAELDEARDYDAASSYNYLNAELARLRAVVRNGGTVCVAGAKPNAPVVLSSPQLYNAWERCRYPHADHD
jgi:hypothetical protein